MNNDTIIKIAKGIGGLLASVAKEKVIEKVGRIILLQGKH